MRPGQNNFKNRNRNRNRRHGGGGGGGGGGNPGNRVLDSNGPDVKLRGTAQTIAEKYMQLARDAASSGDRVMAESYYQHADHYYRLWLAAQPAGQPIQFSRRLDEDVEDLEGGAEADDEAADATEGGEAGEAAAAGDAAPAEGEAAAAGDEQGQRNFRPREGRDQNRDQQGGGRDRFRNRWPRRGERNQQDQRDGNGQAVEGAADEGDRAERPERPERAERQERAERPERQERGERQDRPRRERNEAASPDEGGKDWEAPSFLKRPMPAVANGSDAAEGDAGGQE
ncbi:MAG: DUF4167 domain-containing protein, partial [Rhizobiales bacterium]|nr:DUF4167 domain-containing protein [Hyphomicrobiales bacterium]